jgi:hypothetical protein
MIARSCDRSKVVTEHPRKKRLESCTRELIMLVMVSSVEGWSWKLERSRKQEVGEVSPKTKRLPRFFLDPDPKLSHV